MSYITKCTITELASLQRDGLSCLEIAEAYIKNAQADPYNAYITVTGEQALERAMALDRIREDRKAFPLFGIPYAAKDNICTKDILTTCASKMLAEHLPVYDATAIRYIHSAGGVLIGKTNMDEFGMGSSSDTGYFGKVINPFNEQRSVGGSSGGSAVAVATGACAFALGSDTGGSVRLPAAFNGVVGVKPTYGRISRYGLIAFASSLDQIGVLTKDVTDSATVLEQLCGKDAMDSTSSEQSADLVHALSQGIQGMRIAVIRELTDIADSQTRLSITNAAAMISKLGGTVEEISVPEISKGLWAYYVISSAEASSNLARYDGVRYGYSAPDRTTLSSLYTKSRSEGFGTEVKRRLLLGGYVLSAENRSAYYLKALAIRNEIKTALSRVFKDLDCLLCPVSPNISWECGFQGADTYKNDICTVIANITGLPAMSLPCGTDSNGVPMGLQLMANSFNEQALYRVGYALEQALKGGTR